ncbi:ECF transporter S component [Enterococcus caccae]|uniref:Membrane protein n=1 Tax=Enterococcus caccae ATCC BAA-1240 TaxID=1158612 RepID=R3W845_9ENTE|nr:ECF transporter S component [Enterococcus caccae]EOL43682.1 membrane protein [Enterococcus caccae ATCC BAA-1240]EOT67918.1 membrane protein [Enterococcus caccae ATCC BAA-1240]OJG28593.1 membrane protein [Enterococcus caccae]
MKNTKTFTLTAMFLAILILLSAVPFLGFIPIGPINATTMHIPVIIASIVLGPRIGAFLGGVFGLISMIRSTVILSPLSFVFSPFIPVIGTDQGSWKAIIVAMLPRILIGVVPYFIFIGLKKLTKNKPTSQTFSLFIAGFLGSATNTILVMNLIYFLFKDSYAQSIGANGAAVYTAILTVIFTSGIVEAVVAAIATVGVTSVLLRLVKNNATQKL